MLFDKIAVMQYASPLYEYFKKKILRDVETSLAEERVHIDKLKAARLLRRIQRIS